MVLQIRYILFLLTDIRPHAFAHASYYTKTLHIAKPKTPDRSQIQRSAGGANPKLMIYNL